MDVPLFGSDNSYGGKKQESTLKEQLTLLQIDSNWTFDSKFLIAISLIFILVALLLCAQQVFKTVECQSRPNIRKLFSDLNS